MWILQDGLHGHLSISGTMWRSCVLVQVRLLPLLILSLITIFIYISHFFSHRWVPVFVITGIVAWSYYAYVAELCIKNVESDAVKVWYLYMFVTMNIKCTKNSLYTYHHHKSITAFITFPLCLLRSSSWSATTSFSLSSWQATGELCGLVQVFFLIFFAKGKG